MATFNALWIVESLRPNDLKTGRNLAETLRNEFIVSSGQLKVHYRKPTSRAELLEVLTDMADAAGGGEMPMLHLDFHGGPDGLQTTNQEVVDWETLRTPLVAVNQQCKMNLVIVVAACDGVWLIQTARRLDRAPFWAVIGPDKEVKAVAVERDYLAFYKAFFSTLSGDKAVAALNATIPPDKRHYHFVSAEGIFKRVYSGYHQNYCVGEGKRRRIENILTEAMSNPEIATLGIGEVRRNIKATLSDYEAKFEEYKEQFFMLDLYPENKGRFRTSFSDVVTPRNTA